MCQTYTAFEVFKTSRDVGNRALSISIAKGKKDLIIERFLKKLRQPNRKADSKLRQNNPNIFHLCREKTVVKLLSS